MEPETEFLSMVRQVLNTAFQFPTGRVFPTLLIDRPPALKDRPWKNLGRADDIAIKFYLRHGFFADRVRMNLHGYPGLMRALASPPPWIDVEPEGIENEPTPDRAYELRPLIDQASTLSAEALVSEFLSHRQHARAVTEKFLDLGPISAQAAIDDASVTAFRELIALAHAIGPQTFERVFSAIFDLEIGDEFLAARGAPDLLVWHPTATPALWFFAEVKAPGDYLSGAQKLWIEENWDLVQHHFIVTMLA